MRGAVSTVGSCENVAVFIIAIAVLRLQPHQISLF